MVVATEQIIAALDLVDRTFVCGDMVVAIVVDRVVCHVHEPVVPCDRAQDMSRPTQAILQLLVGVDVPDLIIKIRMRP